MSLLLALTGTTVEYTLACDAGAYAINGNDAELLVNHNYVLSCDAGSYAIAGVDCVLLHVRAAVEESSSGGFFLPQTKRRTKKEALRERELMRLKIQDVEAVAEKIVEEKSVAKNAKTVDSVALSSTPDIDYLVNQLMAKLRLTAKSPDYTRAIQAALAAKKLKDAKRLRDEEDEEALLLFM